MEFEAAQFMRLERPHGSRTSSRRPSVRYTPALQQIERSALAWLPPECARWARLLVSLGAGLGAAVLVALALTIVDLYLAGHGQPLLSRPWLDVEGLGVHLSRADAVLLLAAVLGSALTWRGTAAGGA
jgi:hypothetical protein